MLVQIHPIQVPVFWEAIKFASVNSDSVKEEYLEYYCIELLQDLLAGDKVCFIAQEKDEILFVVIITFQVNKMTGMKFLFFNNLYSFKPQEDAVWKNVFIDLHKIAENNSCEAIIGESNNIKINAINMNIGASCISKKYAYYL